MFTTQFARRILFLSVGLMVLLAACGGGAGGVAATVNGVDISVSDVEAMRVYDEATVAKAAFAEDLTNAIINIAVITAARDEFSIEPSTDEIAVKKEELVSQIEADQGTSIEDLLETQGLPIEHLDVIAQLQIIGDRLFTAFQADAVPATDADARARMTACVRHILVPTEQEALDALGRIEGGEDFAAVATELGTDATAPGGGDLGCQPLGTYVGEFADAAYDATVGTVTDPVETEFGWHLLLVESRDERSLIELREEIDVGRVNELVNAWLLEKVNGATVEVDEQYGVWVTDPAGMPMVQPPSS